MSELTVIIPTLQKNKAVLDKLISVIASDDVVSKIILIDNTTKGYSFDCEKLQVIVPKKNMFVNPSWNYGVSLVETKYFALFNDDLLVSNNFCSNVVKELEQIQDLGICGMATESVINTQNVVIPEEKELKLIKKDGDRISYWGVILFGETSRYSNIPENIKIYCGDDYYRYHARKSGLGIYNICNCEVYHLGSLSSSDNAFQKLLWEDIFEYIKVDKDFKNSKAFKDGIAILIEFILKHAKKLKIKEQDKDAIETLLTEDEKFLKKVFAMIVNPRYMELEKDMDYTELEKICSIKNTVEYKIITIFGQKIYLKRKKKK